MSAGEDGTVRIWDPASGRQRGELVGHRGGVWAVALGKIDGASRIVSAGDDRTVRIWDPASGRQLGELVGHRDWVRAVAVGAIDGASRIVSAGDDGTVRIWRSDGGQTGLILSAVGPVVSVCCGAQNTLYLAAANTIFRVDEAVLNSVEAR